MDKRSLENLLEDHALVHDLMDINRVHRVRVDMERAEARRLQPHYIESFFIGAFQELGGTIKRREPRRYEITHVPAVIKNRDRLIGTRTAVSPRYERIAFEKKLLTPLDPPGQPAAAFVCPGHPLLNATIDLILERHRDLLRRGTILVDDNDQGTSPRILFYLEHSIQDAGLGKSGERRIVSKRLLFVEIDRDGAARHINYAPYLDYRPLRDDEPSVADICAHPDLSWIKQDLETAARTYAITNVVREHLTEVSNQKLPLLDKTEAAVKDRLTKEINYWDLRAEQLKAQEQAGKPNARVNSGEARKRADELQARLQRRMDEIKKERQLSPLPPVVLGGVLVIPAGLIAKMMGRSVAENKGAVDIQAAAARARSIIMKIERDLGFVPVDRETEKLGYDIESGIPGTGRLRFLEVKGRVSSATTITVTRNEILYSLNKPDDFILAIVEFQDNGGHKVHYVREPFKREPDFGAASVNYDFAELLERAEAPR